MASCIHCRTWDGQQTAGAYLCSDKCRQCARDYVAAFDALCQARPSTIVPLEMFYHARDYREALKAEMKGD